MLENLRFIKIFNLSYLILSNKFSITFEGNNLKNLLIRKAIQSINFYTNNLFFWVCS